MKDVHVHSKPTSGPTTSASKPAAASAIYANEMSLEDATAIRISAAPTDASDIENSVEDVNKVTHTTLFSECDHDDNDKLVDIYVEPITVLQNRPHSPSDVGDVKHGVVSGSAVDCVEGLQTNDRPEIVISVPDCKTPPSGITPLATSSVRHGGSNTIVTMMTTISSDARRSVMHQSSSLVAKTTKTTFVPLSSATSSGTSTKLKTSEDVDGDFVFSSSSTRSVKTLAAVTMATESLTNIAQERGKVNGRLTSDVNVVNGSSIKVNVMTEGDSQFSRDPKVNELPKGLVQSRLKVINNLSPSFLPAYLSDIYLLTSLD